MKQFIFFLLLLAVVNSGCSNAPKTSDSVKILPDTLSDAGNTDTVENDCLFDTSMFKLTTEALKKYNPDIRFVWNQDDHAATTVLENGDTLTLSIGGCNHFGYSAMLITDIPFEEVKQLTEKARWLAVTFFSNSFDVKFNDCISNGNFHQTETQDSLKVKLFMINDPDAENTNMADLAFSFTRHGNKTVIIIGGYMT